MAQSDLHTLLSRLGTDLKQARTVDPASRRLLEELAQEIQPFVENAPGLQTVDDYRTLKDRLARAVAEFEGLHPELTQSIEALLDTLGQHTL